MNTPSPLGSHIWNDFDTAKFPNDVLCRDFCQALKPFHPAFTKLNTSFGEVALTLQQIEKDLKDINSL